MAGRTEAGGPVLATGVPAALAVLILSWGARPAVGVHDSGELAAAAFHLGIAHPAGSPLWVLLAKGISLLPIAGGTALRMALLSALAGGLAAGTAAALLLRHEVVPAAAAALGLAVVLLPRSLWAGTMVEVYALELALAMVLVLAAWEAGRRQDDPRAAAAAAFAGGLLLAVHHSLLPAVLLCLAALLLQAGPRTVRAAWMAGGLALGLTPYLELPLRAWRRSPVMWTDTGTFAGLWHHLTSAQYLPGVRGGGWSRLGAALAVTGEPLPWLVLPLAVVGLALLWRRSRPAAVALAGPALADLAAVVWLQDMPLGSEAYLVTAAGLAGLAAAVTVGRVLSRRPRLAPAAILIPLALLAASRGWLDPQSMPARWTTARRLAAAPPGALVWLRGDSAAFPAHYQQLVEGWRPDLTLLHPWSLVGAPWLGPRVRNRLGSPEAARERDRQAEVLLERARAANRAVLHQDRAAFGRRLVPRGTLWSFGPAASPPGAAVVSPLPGERRWRHHPDPTVRGLAQMDHLPLAFTAALKGDMDGARREAELAADSEPSLATVHRALGQGWLDLGMVDAARLELERAVALDPSVAEVWLALGVARARQGDLEAAVAAWRRALELRPGWEPALVNIRRAERLEGTGSIRPVPPRRRQ